MHCRAAPLTVCAVVSLGGGIVEDDSWKVSLLGQQFYDHFGCELAVSIGSISLASTADRSFHFGSCSHVLGSRVRVRKDPWAARRGQRADSRVCNGCSAGSRTRRAGAVSRLYRLCCIFVRDQRVYRWQVLVAFVLRQFKIDSVLHHSEQKI